MENWESVIRECCSMSTLLWLALQDKKYLGVTRIGLVVTSGLLLFSGCFGNVGWQSRVGGAAVGMILLLFGFLSRGAIGFADGVIVFVCGVAYGFYETVALCFFAAVYAGCFSGLLLIFKKAGRKSRIPFLPFLLLGYITMRIMISSL